MTQLPQQYDRDLDSIVKDMRLSAREKHESEYKDAQKRKEEKKRQDAIRKALQISNTTALRINRMLEGLNKKGIEYIYRPVVRSNLVVPYMRLYNYKKDLTINLFNDAIVVNTPTETIKYEYTTRTATQDAIQYITNYISTPTDDI